MSSGWGNHAGEKKGVALAGSGISELRVLIVDDAPDMLRLLRGMLSSLGITRIEDARDGREALMMVRRFHPTFLVVDWEMEPMDGYTLVHHLRGTKSGPDAKVPVIMMSTNAEPARIMAARKLGVSHFILKPVVPARLADRMQWALDHPIDYVEVDEQWVPREFAG